MKKNDGDNNSEDPELRIIREFLDSANLDASGYIDETELAAVVDLSSEEIKQIFHKLDTDNDGKISIEQFTEYYKEQQNSNDGDDHDGAGSKKPNTGKQMRLNLTKDSIRDSGYSMSEPSHRKNRPRVQQSEEAKRKAAKYLGQEYLDDLYEVARSRDDPLLLESLENFLAATVDNLLQKQADNERLDAALKHAKDQNSEIAAQIEEEMEQQVVALEQKIRNEEQEKLVQQKNEAHVQLLRASSELSEMEHKVMALEDRLTKQKLKEHAIPETFVEKIHKKEQENQQLQNKLLEFQTQMAVMRTEVAGMKSEYDEQAARLNNERGTVLGCIQEQENLTRQLQMLHEANKKLHDTNDDLRSALDVKKSSSFISEGPSPIKRSQSCAYRGSPFHHNDLQSSFRSDPGFMRYHSTLNNTDFNDTDEDSRQSFPHDDDDAFINRQSLMTELMNADDQYESPLDTSQMRSTSLPPSLHGDHRSQPPSEREHFSQQLEVMAETNRRLGESNDELRHALSLMSDQVRSERSSDRGSDILSMRESPPGCYSAPTTPMRGDYTEDVRPNSTSSPRKVILTKSGYHSLSQSHSAPDISSYIDSQDSFSRGSRTDVDTSTFCTTCDAPKIRGVVSACDTCNEKADTDNIIDDISLDADLESSPFSFQSSMKDTPTQCDLVNKNRKPTKVTFDTYTTANPFDKSTQMSDIEPLDHNDLIQPLNENDLQSGLSVLPKDGIEEGLIEASDASQVESENDDLNDLFKKLDQIPPSVCDTCYEEKQVSASGKLECYCTTVARKRLEESTLLTDSDSDDEYTDQETSQDLDKQVKPIIPTNASEQYTTYDGDSDDNDDDDVEKTDDISKSSAFDCPYEKPKSTTSRQILLHNLESEMSMYAHAQSDEETDEDDMSDEELIRLVDQTTNDTASMTDEPITVEEKVLIDEPRGLAVGADASSESTTSGDVSGEPDEMFKLVLAGNAAVGKSSFIIRLCKNKFYSALNSTLGVDFQMKRLNVDKRNIALQLWDTAGQERFRSIAKSYFRRVDGVILLYDVTCESSFLDVRDWIESIESSAADRVPIILCGNKVDLRPDALKVGMPVITREQGRALANEVGALFVETSAKEGTNIHKTCKDLIRMMQEKEKPKPTDAFPLDPNNNQNNKKKLGCCRS